MPKLYFYDTGLVCALLGITEPVMLNFHPLAGSIFENFVVSELVKYRYNKALPLNMFFWRDNIGHEIDIISEKGDKLFPVEIKSGRTITSDFFKNLIFWQSVSGTAEGAVIYGGDSAQERSNGITVVPWQKLGMLYKRGVI